MSSDGVGGWFKSDPLYGTEFEGVGNENESPQIPQRKVDAKLARLGEKALRPAPVQEGEIPGLKGRNIAVGAPQAAGSVVSVEGNDGDSASMDWDDDDTVSVASSCSSSSSSSSSSASTESSDSSASSASSYASDLSHASRSSIEASSSAVNSMPRMEDRIRMSSDRLDALPNVVAGSTSYAEDLSAVKSLILVLDATNISPKEEKDKLLLSAFAKMDVHIHPSVLDRHVALVKSEREFVEAGSNFKATSGEERNTLFCKDGEQTKGVFKPQLIRQFREAGVTNAASFLGELGGSFPASIPSSMDGVPFRAAEEAVFLDVDGDGNVQEGMIPIAEEADEGDAVKLSGAKGVFQEAVSGVVSKKREFSEEKVDKRSFQNACMLNIMFGLRDQKMHSVAESNFLFVRTPEEKLEVKLFDLDVPPVGYVERTDVTDEDFEEYLEQKCLSSVVDEFRSGTEQEKKALKEQYLPVSTNCALMGFEMAHAPMSLEECADFAQRTLKQLEGKEEALAAMAAVKVPLGKSVANIGGTEKEAGDAFDEDEFDDMSFEFDRGAEEFEGELRSTSRAPVDEEEEIDYEPLGATTMHSAEDVEGDRVSVYSKKQVGAVRTRMERTEAFMRAFLDTKAKVDAGELPASELKAFSMYDIMAAVTPDYHKDYQLVAGKRSDAANVVGEESPKVLTARL